MFRIRTRETDTVDFRDKDIRQVKAAVHRLLKRTSDSTVKEVPETGVKTIHRQMTSIMAKDIMTRPVHVLRADMPFTEIGHLFYRHHISGAPVVDHLGRIIGVVSEKDILSNLGIENPYSFIETIRSNPNVNSPVNIHARRLCACDIMTTPPVTVKDDVCLDQLSTLMIDNRINRVPVVQYDGRPIGIVTRSDLVKSCYAGC